MLLNPAISVTLLGSGGGPNPNPERLGPGILVEAGVSSTDVTEGVIFREGGSW
jgi:hypothetical protein